MLRQLLIESYGLIERADVEFAGGATVFTGETGSGKTMLVGALDFALGARGGADVVRRGARRALVTVVFDPDDALRERFAADGFDLDPGESATIAREMSDAGRSTLRVNGRAATAAYVRELRDAIVEIVGQHEAQRLLSAQYHLDLLDRFAGEPALALRGEVASAYARAQETSELLAQLTQDERRLRERYDDAVFALAEIDAARLESGETERLAERRRYLDNVERIATALRGAREALSAEERGATGALGAAAAALAGLGAYNATLRELADRSAALQSEAGELAADVARAHEEAEYDPTELDAINARLDLIERLQRKYGGSIDEIVATAGAARATVDEYEGRDRRVAELEERVAAAHRELREAATALTRGAQARVNGAAKTDRRRVRRDRARLGQLRGGDRTARTRRRSRRRTRRVSLRGQCRRAGAAVSSRRIGRRTLARSARARRRARGALDAPGALVFDEIDAGIGGATATAVGARIGELARRGQVLCVTHLAQLATWADRHYVLDKIEAKGGTTIVVRPVDARKEREAEIARMLSGESHDAALRHARALLGSVASTKVSGGS